MKRIFQKLNLLLDRRQKIKMAGIMALMLVGGTLETMSITLILPLIQVLLKPEIVTGDNPYGTVYRAIRMSSPTQFVALMLILLIVAFAVKNLFLFWQNVVTLKFVYTNQFATSRRMMINYMKRPYEYYLNADTAVIQRSITSDVNNMYALILNLLQLGSELVVFTFIISALLIKDALMILTIAALLILVLAVIKAFLKPIMLKAGKDNQDYYSGLFKWISQSVTGIKEIKVARREAYFIEEYAKCGAGYVDAVQKYGVCNSTPRLLIETCMIAGMILYLLLMLFHGADMSRMVPQLSVFSLAAMRLLPSANRVNNYLTNISYFEPFFMGVSDSLQEEIHDTSIEYDVSAYKRAAAERGRLAKLEIRKEIELRDIVYRYPHTDTLIFDHAGFVIPIGSAVGIVGTSGAGKTTIVDILLGLLKPECGEILADGVNVGTQYDRWLKNIGYIPQTIFMLDDSIRKNVAFGVPEEEIDDARVWAALKEAQLDEFVRGLPEGMQTGIGERGIRISGGQRQRIGIARALFEDPEVLVLDEATSALDGETEAAIMDSINRLHGKKTLLIIAHRLQTIEKCDMVYRVEHGRITRER